MNEIIKCMIERRTIRRFKAEQISDEKLNAILDAGIHAPNAGGAQSAIIVVSQNAGLNERLGMISRNVENLANARLGRVSSEQPSIIDDTSIMSAFYNAPTVLTVFAKKDNYNLTGDCFAVAENIVVAAWSFGIGACIVGRCAKTFSTDEGAKIQELWGLGNEYEARVHVVLGYPDGNPPVYKPRKEGRIIFSK
jgi:nitroreductase